MHIRLLILLFILMSGLSYTFAQTPDAVVEVVVGKAFVKAKKESKESGQLKDGDGLFAGQWVSCPVGCERLIISYCNVSRPIGAKPLWKQIFAINCKPPEGQRGGGVGAVAVAELRTFIESEEVRPTTFDLKWHPSVTRQELELWLRTSNGERIWGPYKVDENGGKTISDSLRQILSGAQANGNLNLELSASYGSEETQRIKIELMSAAREVELERKLELVNVEPDEVAKAIGRASVFDQFGLITSEVKELERALVIAKGSESPKHSLNFVENLTFEANLKAKNNERVTELCDSSTSPSLASNPVCLALREIDKPRVLVLATASSSTTWTTNFTAATLEDALSQSGRFEVISGTKRDRLLREQGFNYSHFMNPEQAAKAGRLLSARYIIVGNTLDVTIRKKGGGFSPIDFDSQIKTRIQIQIIDADTGIIKASKSFEERANKSPAIGAQTDDDSLHAAYRKTIESISSKFLIELGETIPTETIVLLVRGNRVALDVGGKRIKVGQEFEVYSRDEAILGPDGKPRGYIKKKHARLQIVQVEADLSWAKLIETYDEKDAPDPAVKIERIKRNMLARKIE